MTTCPLDFAQCAFGKAKGVMFTEVECTRHSGICNAKDIETAKKKIEELSTCEVCKRNKDLGQSCWFCGN